jgi:outer membrane protein OmpA-like peptidoglycan-associated protein
MEFDMSYKFIALGIAALVAATPGQAQRRGTVEFGAFGGATSFDNSLNIDNGTGAGLRIGAFLDPRWAVEFDGSGMGANRIAGSPNNVHVTSLAGRLLFTPLVFGPVSAVIGGGGVHTDYGTQSSYGMSGLLGAKFALNDRVALRVDAIADYMPKRKETNAGIRAGFSVFRQPGHRVQTVMTTLPPAPAALHLDSVSATEQRRLRQIEANYTALRDSLARPALMKPMAPSSATALATMHEMIHFASDSSVLSDSAKVTLDSKLEVFRNNPAMRIVIVGNTDERATDAYNQALGGRRADAAKAYLVSKGVNPVRIEIASRGESQPIATGTSLDAQAQNRRVEFRLLVASDHLLPPKK